MKIRQPEPLQGRNKNDKRGVYVLLRKYREMTTIKHTEHARDPT